MQRFKEKELNNWFESSNRKPLIIWGARQVGKTYLLLNFFAKKFKEYIYIDLIKDDESRNFFNITIDPKKYLEYIETRFGKKITNDCPLIFDEIQACINVISSLKYFEQDYKNLPVIATGSLVRTSIKESNNKENFIFPVGKVDSMDVFPLTFEEYIYNVNEMLYKKIVSCFNNRKKMEEYEHALAFEYLYKYLSIGGMPEALDVFIKTESYLDAVKVLDSIYNNYIGDMDQYNISNETVLKTRNVYRNIFSQLNKENKNFKITNIDKGKSNRDYLNAYEWLELARIVYRSNKLDEKISLPLIEKYNSGLFRLYLSDVGIFASQSGINRSDFFVKDNRNKLAGIFYENYVACEFVANGIELFYWCGRNKNEFEFIVAKDGEIIPIDVKKGRGRLNSLDNFREMNKNNLAIKISSNNFGYDENNKILTIPLYAAFMVAKWVKGFANINENVVHYK